MRRVLQIAAVGLGIGVVACGGNKATGPSANNNGTGSTGGSTGTTCTSVGPLGSAKGTLTASLSGFGTFNGGVSAGGAVYTPIAAVPSLGLPAQDTFVIGGVCGDGSQIVLTARALVGTIEIGVDGSGNPRRDPQTNQPWVHIIQFIQVVNGAAAGGWYTSIAGGSGTVTVTSVSPTSAAGSFSITMVANPATPATGTKTVTGQFNVTF